MEKKRLSDVRHFFDLAQKLKQQGKHKDAIVFYKKFIKVCEKCEETWYSYYMIGDSYHYLKNSVKFEQYMQLAYHDRPNRAEPIYKLASFFRNTGDHYKSFHYIKLGRSIHYPKKDVLFVEGNVYNGLFDYEISIVDYYVHPEQGLKDSINAMVQL